MLSSRLSKYLQLWPLAFSGQPSFAMGGDQYKNKLILAPMVRAGTLPMRLLALDYGADLVYSEELVDIRLLKCERVVNDLLGTVDYCADGEVVFRTCPAREQGRVVLQIGTNDALRALTVAKMVEKDVAAIDVNMGCPKAFSIHSGMGAALLGKPEKVKEICTTLVEGCSVPITCKIRVLPKIEDTLALCRLIESCGVSAIAIHGRTKDERPQHANRNEVLRRIADTLTIPVIASGGSGEISGYASVDAFRRATGCSSVMLARAVLRDPSVFRRQGPIPVHDSIRSYLKYCIDFDSPVHNVKYVLQRLLGSEQSTTAEGRCTVAATTLDELCEPWNTKEYLLQVRQHRRENNKKRKLEENGTEPDYCHISLAFKKLKKAKVTPKDTLMIYCHRNHLESPQYSTTQRDLDKKWLGKVAVCKTEFASKHGQPNKKAAEQQVALIALNGLQLRHLLPGDDWEDAGAQP